MFFGVLQNGRRLSEADWRGIHPGARRVEIEIGPGNGLHLRTAAHERPDTLFVGLEMRASTVASALGRGPLPPNVRLLHADGRWVVEQLLGENTIDAYHVYFPDPWWKKRHHKRRLFRTSFVEAAAATLKPGGDFYLISDVETAFSQASGGLHEAGLEARPWTRAQRAGGSYERKYRRQGRTLHHARFVKPTA